MNTFLVCLSAVFAVTVAVQAQHQIPLSEYSVEQYQIPGTELYQNIFEAYTNGFQTKDFDKLLADVSGNLSHVLCLCINDGTVAQENLIAIKAQSQSSQLASKIDVGLGNIQDSIAAAQLRYDYFFQNWTTMLSNYRKVPEALFAKVIPFVQKNLPDTATKMSGMIFSVCGNISSAVAESASALTDDISETSGR